MSRFLKDMRHQALALLGEVLEQDDHPRQHFENRELIQAKPLPDFVRVGSAVCLVGKAGRKS